MNPQIYQETLYEAVRTVLHRAAYRANTADNFTELKNAAQLFHGALEIAQLLDIDAHLYSTIEDEWQSVFARNQRRITENDESW